MNYDTPELRDRLAAEYVLGTMPALVRRRFERLLAASPELRRAVEDWNARFDPIDGDADIETPPAHVWRAVERRLALPPTRPALQPATRPATLSAARSGWLGSLALWRGATLAATALAAAALFYIALRPPPPAPNVVAILIDDKGDPGWVALGGAEGSIAVAPLRQLAVDAAHAYELWVIADGKPRPLGLLAAEPGHALRVEASLVPAGGVLAVSLEPAGGSPSGLPTGPVPYKGTVLPTPR